MPSRIGKALGGVLGVQVTQKASRGSLSSYIINAPAQYGQPLPMAGDAYSAITPERMREVAFKTPTAAACERAILDFASTVKPKIRNVDAAQPVAPAQAQLVQSILRSPNPQEGWKRFVRKLMRDIIELGFGAVEIEPNAAGGVANLHVLDGRYLRVDFDEHGTVLGYDQLNQHGMPIAGADKVHAWQPQEVIWFVLDPRSDTVYGTSIIAQIFVLGIIESLMLQFVGARFTDSNIPFGVYDIGDVSQDEIDFAISQWNKQAEKQGYHRIIIGSSKGGAKWTPFGYHLKDLDATNLFVTIRQMIMGEFGVTMNELGDSQDINKSNGYNLSFVFKHRALIPLLDEVYDTLSSVLVSRRMGVPDLEIGYEEIDSRDDLLQSQIDELQLKSGVQTINAVRNRQGLPSIPGGEANYIFTGSAWIPVAMMFDFAQAQLQSLLMVNLDMEAAAGGGGSGAGAGKVSPPLVRPMQEPEQGHTPDARGSSTARVSLPRANMGQTGGQRTRGAVQTSRAQGQRKEDLA